MNRVGRVLASIVLPLLLAGCGLPPAYTVVKGLADGVMWVATGKTSTDHGLSFLTGRDCLLLRVAQGSDVCRVEITEAQAYNAAQVPSVKPIAVAEPIELPVRSPQG